MPSALSHVLNF